MPVEFDGPELVLGGFKSVRGFRIQEETLASLNNHRYVYDDPSKVYTSVCTYKPSIRDLVLEEARSKAKDIIGVIYDIKVRTYSEEEYVTFVVEFYHRVTVVNTPQIYWAKQSFWEGDTVLNYATTSFYDYEEVKQEVEVVLTRSFIDAFTMIPHEAPVSNHTCGFYSFYGSLQGEEKKTAWNSFGVAASDFIGVVENSGRVIHGSQGLRSEKMKILGVAPLTFNAAAAIRPLTNSGFEVFGTEKELIQAYPPDSIEGVFDTND